ncbi:high-mobility group 20A [Ophiocordyceps camponoti-floridani]|uniref:High-mobility group 20A n=1 Tax=Ophiocordyceps camponoti-floridani TaxID=2030778 RepID=A0A8H4VAI2_9HYPO|nr:high-mobility group 20A [Ophiocordyceps camponoti-floridani]
MTRQLDGVFAELGLSQYLEAFIDQGFDAWDTILDIQESDLDALGVKLGHRRKLQRRIANSRGIAPSVSLACAKPNADEAKPDATRRDSIRSEPGHESNGVAKRKYRRHPKPDENAPERPPSAYVLFSNKMREDLKSHNLTFTEIAKLVGENWQNLPSAEKESYESQANAAKEKYHASLASYKKTPEYRKYLQYLHDFKEKQARQSKGHDAAKRLRLEPPRLQHSSTTCTATPGGATPGGSRSGSSSERLRGSEPPSSRSESQTTPVTVSGLHTPLTPAHLNNEESKPTRFETDDESTRRNPSWSRRSGRQPLPSLSDMLVDDGSKADGGGVYSHAGSGSGQTRMVPDGPPIIPRTRVPRLVHEPSSNSTVGSRSSRGSFGRSSGDGSVPIYALLADRTLPASSAMEMSSPAIKVAAASLASRLDSPNRPMASPKGYGFLSDSSAFQNMKIDSLGDGDVLMSPVSSPTTASSKRGLDGMSALLHAGEIVGRRDHG